MKIGYYGIKKETNSIITQPPIIPAPVTYQPNPYMINADTTQIPSQIFTIPPTVQPFRAPDTIQPYPADITTSKVLPVIITKTVQPYTQPATIYTISPITTSTFAPIASTTTTSTSISQISTPPVIILSTSFCFYTLNTAYNTINQDGQIMGSIGNIKPDVCCNICGMYPNCHGFNYDKKNLLCSLLTNIDTLSTVDDENSDLYGIIRRGNSKK